MRYSKSFYERFAVVNVPAAKRVMEELVQLAQPQSAIDLGCGERSFLSVLPAFGVIDSLGVEGPWVGDEQLQIPVERALRRDLDEPFPMERRYDLVISIEVAEHLRPERAETLVDDLTHLADLVLFSTAIPGQGGAHHLNEPSQSHWARLFGEPGYTVIDILHPPALRDARKPRGVGHQLTRQAPAAPRHTIRRLDPHGERRQRQAALSAMRIVNRKSQSS